jgi:hypothetical protein
MSLEPDNLDSILKQGKWPGASPQSTRRLEQVWNAQWNAPSQRSWRIWPVAAAAAIIVALGSVLVVTLYRPRPQPIVTAKPQQAPQPKTTLAMMESRPPTMYERMVLGDLRVKAKAPATAPVQVAKVAPVDPPPAKRDEILDLLDANSPEALASYLEFVADPARRDEALSALDRVKRPPVDELIQELGNPHTKIRFAAARALGRINGPATTEALIALVEQNKQKRAALAALLLCRGEDAADFLADARHTPRLAATVRAVEIQLNAFQ